MTHNRKPIPKSILIFGAANHIGRPMAEYIAKTAPQVQLCLVSSNEDRAEALKKDFPKADIVVADYYDLPSMEAALDGIEGVYMSSPITVDPKRSMNNFVAAAKKSGTLVHMVRQIAIMPEYNKRLNPRELPARPGVDPTPDYKIKEILDDSLLPVTYINFGGSFMDNFLKVTKIGIRRERKLIWHGRKVPYVDPREIAEVVANLLLSDNHRHIGCTHTINNGHDNHTAEGVAKVMSEAFGETITFEGSRDAFLENYSSVFGPVAPGIWAFFEYESEYEVGWALNDFAETMLGRKPKTLHDWFVEHKDQILG
ncbi:NmrA family NAD(P)-binding protein [Phaeobacter sp. C3_T13_0]|uniref:NmrA family NAD(P)-binding protein n=1 Tax=Phaeobacter cretensis TaxID=3342641 RepID=UPI0039BC2B0D